MTSKYGFKCSFNPTFFTAASKEWISKGYYGLDQGPIVLMIENYRSGFLWRLCAAVLTSLMVLAAQVLRVGGYAILK
jgi:hypothetical protein